MFGPLCLPSPALHSDGPTVDLSQLRIQIGGDDLVFPLRAQADQPLIQGKTCDGRLSSILHASYALTVSSYTKTAGYKCSLQTSSVLST